MKLLRCVVVAVAVAGPSLAVLAQAREPDISGYYNEKGDEFTKITRSGDVYQYLQHSKAGDWIGVAIREDDHLTIGWHRSDGRNLGVSSYRIQRGSSGPTLVGGWAAYPGGRVVQDTLSWSRKPD
jgi:hypothetical protein